MHPAHTIPRNPLLSNARIRRVPILHGAHFENRYRQLMAVFDREADELDRRIRKLNPATLSNYRRLYAKMKRENLPPIQISTTKSAYWTYMSAWRFGTKEMLVDLGRRARALIANEPPGATTADAEVKRKEIVGRAVEYLRDLDQFSVPTNQKLFNEKAKRSAKSVKHRDKELRPDWREVLLDHAIKSGSKYADAIAVMWLCGCRPAELELGVSISIEPDGIRFRIRGVKTHGGKYGHEWREFVVTDQNDASRHLRGDGSTETLRTIYADAHRLSDSVAKLGRAAFPNPEEARPTAYSFRNRISSNLKGARVSRVGVAEVLGHCVTTTQGYYARGRKNPQPFGIKNIRTERQVRVPEVSKFVADKIEERKLPSKGIIKTPSG